MAMSDEYDFIVVGGGTAGLVVAARLSQNSNIRVLVLEAGEDHLKDPRVSIPGAWHTMLGTEVDWDFFSIPQAGHKYSYPIWNGFAD